MPKRSATGRTSSTTWQRSPLLSPTWRSVRSRRDLPAEGYLSRTTGADSICPERARSAGSRTALAPLQFRKMGCQNERKKLAQIRYQVTCCGIKLESGDLPRFFMIDEIDHARLEKKKSSDCLCQRVRADAVVLARLSFSEASLALSCQ